jgi:sugar O-acyltransferase (sialic acid O-acetyltransferase NeuD family)
MSTHGQPIAVVSLEWDVVDLIESTGAHQMIGFFDASPACDTREFRYLGNDENWTQVLAEMPELRIALAIDYPVLRERLYSHYRGSAAIVNLQSPYAYVSSRASLGHGCIVQRGVTVMPYARVGVACKLNVNSTVHHDAVIGRFSTLSPGSQILGNVTVGERVYIGAGAIIHQRCRVGDGALVGAGAVVVADVPPGAVVVGVPAKRTLRLTQ